MPVFALDKVEVYLFRRRAGRVAFLALRRAPGRRLAGVWQPVTGKRERGESILQAARREVWEETGIHPERWWLLESVTLYVDPEGGRLVALPLLAAEAPPGARVRLSPEHDRSRFVSARTAGRLYLWDAQRQALAALSRQVLRGGPLAEALRLAPPSPERPRRVRGHRSPRHRAL